MSDSKPIIASATDFRINIEDGTKYGEITLPDGSESGALITTDDCMNYLVEAYKEKKIPSVEFAALKEKISHSGLPSKNQFLSAVAIFLGVPRTPNVEMRIKPGRLDPGFRAKLHKGTNTKH